MQHTSWIKVSSLLIPVRSKYWGTYFWTLRSHRSHISLMVYVCTDVCIFTCTVHSSLYCMCGWMHCVFVCSCRHATWIPAFQPFGLRPAHSGKQTGATRREGKMKFKNEREREEKKEWEDSGFLLFLPSWGRDPRGYFCPLWGAVAINRPICDVISCLFLSSFLLLSLHLPRMFHCLSKINIEFFFSVLELWLNDQKQFIICRSRDWE